MASLCRDLPDLIPMPLVIGTKVTARLRQPQVKVYLCPIRIRKMLTIIYIL